MSLCPCCSKLGASASRMGRILPAASTEISAAARGAGASANSAAIHKQSLPLPLGGEGGVRGSKKREDDAGWAASLESDGGLCMASEQPGSLVTLQTGDMGDSFPVLFRFLAPRPGRKEAAQFFGLSVDEAEIDIGIADEPVAGFGFGDTHGFAGKRFADEDEVAAPFDLAVAAHLAY